MPHGGLPLMIQAPQHLNPGLPGSSGSSLYKVVDKGDEREKRERVECEIEQDLRRAAAFAGYQDDDWNNSSRPYTRRWTLEVVSACFVWHACSPDFGMVFACNA